MPTGRVKWFDADKGFGFLAQDGGEDVYVRRNALPHGVEALKPGQRVEFGMAEGRRGPQALQVRLLEAPPSAVEAARRPAEDLHSLIEDMIRLLETKVQPDLRRDRRARHRRGAAVRPAAAGQRRDRRDRVPDPGQLGAQHDGLSAQDRTERHTRSAATPTGARPSSPPTPCAPWPATWTADPGGGPG